MKKIEWLMVALLIIIGLSCLTISGTTMVGTESIKFYLATLIQICLWMILPLLIVGIIYFINIRKKGKSNNNEQD
jgi:uncharacterized membrane protein